MITVSFTVRRIHKGKKYVTNAQFDYDEKSDAVKLPSKQIAAQAAMRLQIACDELGEIIHERVEYRQKNRSRALMRA